jgi:ABC-2 type transport system ATP-binding protein
MAALTIDVAGLRKAYGSRPAVRDLTLQLGRGEAFGFLGPNGAGKSTSIKMLLGLVKPTGGGGQVLSRPVGNREIRSAIGFLPEHFRFYDWLSATELVTFHGRLCGLDDSLLRRKVPQLLERVGLGAQNSKPIRSFSKGMMQRVGLAQAIVNDPQILFLDEPTSGLDPSGRRLVREIIREQRDRGTTVFLNSHLLGEVEKSCDRVAFISAGRIIAQYKMGEWNSEQIEVELRVKRLSPESLEQLERMTEHLSLEGETLTLQIRAEERLPGLIRCIVEHGGEVYSVIPRTLSLEELFLQKIGPDEGL